MATNTYIYNVLIVEDEEFLARALQDNLTQKGCNISLINNGEEAMRYLEHDAPDIIILDLLMPKRDGFRVIEGIRRNPALKKIPIFVLSNLGEMADIRRAMDLGADDYFVKSHNTISEVVDRVMQLLKKSRPDTAHT